MENRALRPYEQKREEPLRKKRLLCPEAEAWERMSGDTYHTHQALTGNEGNRQGLAPIFVPL